MIKKILLVDTIQKAKEFVDIAQKVLGGGWLGRRFL